MPAVQRHPFLDHLDDVAAQPPHPGWTASDGALPSLYLSHGAPPLFEDRTWMGELHGWARSLPKPTAILVVSAHWEAAPLRLSHPGPAPGLVYDFSGFDPMYKRMRYDTPGAEDLARQVQAMIPGPVHQDASRGLDHGAWVPLKVMYPDADVPVLQLSLPTQDGAGLLELGARLRPLREQGVLVVGSGFLTHGLPHIDWRRPDVVPGWSAEFDAWAAQALAAGDVEELLGFRDRAPGMPFAHPTVEHFTPLFVTLGAAHDPSSPVTPTVEGYFVGLSKRSFQAA